MSQRKAVGGGLLTHFTGPGPVKWLGQLSVDMRDFLVLLSLLMVPQA